MLECCSFVNEAMSNCFVDCGFNKIQEESTETKIKHLFVEHKKNSNHHVDYVSNTLALKFYQLQQNSRNFN